MAWRTGPGGAASPRSGRRSTTTAAGCAGERPRRRSGPGAERSFAPVLDRGGMRRTRPRGRESLQKRDLLHVAGYNLGSVMRLLAGAGIPWELPARVSAYSVALAATNGAARVLPTVAAVTDAAMLVVRFGPKPLG